MKKLFSTCICVLLCVLSFAADRYWVGGGGNTAWATAGNWSLTSGGAGGAAIPTSSDIVIFDGVGVNANGLSTIAATIAIQGLTITAGFTGTIAHNAVLTVWSGNIILGVNYTISGTSGITKNGGGNFTSNGRIWPNNLSFSGNTVTHTFLDNWTVGSLTLGNVFTFNSGVNSIFVNGNYLHNNNVTGDAHIVLQGTGLWSIDAARSTTNNITVTGTYSMVTGNTYTLNGSTLTVVTGTLTVPVGAGVAFVGATINAPNTVFQGISTSGTVTLNALLTCATITNGTGPITYAGAFGFITNGFTQTGTTAFSITFTAGNEYIINTFFTCNQSRTAAIVSFTSSHGTNRVKLTLANGATCNTNARFVRIDAGDGRSINTWNGVVVNCINVNEFEDYKPVGLTW